jgi:hypothetical protein
LIERHDESPSQGHGCGARSDHLAVRDDRETSMFARKLEATKMLRSIAVGLLALTLALTSTESAVAAEEISTTIIEPDGPSEYPDPICTTCVVKTVKSSRADPEHAYIELEYIEPIPLEGEIEVTVWFEDGGSDELIIHDVVLEPGSSESYEVTSNEGWTWDDVREVELVLVPLD